MMIDPEIATRLRWQNSPLIRRMDAVINASKAHTEADARTANNNLTRMVIHHADMLAELYDEIIAGERDGLGYEVTE